MKIIVTKEFPRSEDGHTILTYRPEGVFHADGTAKTEAKPGEPIEVSTACAEYAIAEGFATDEAGKSVPPSLSGAAGSSSSSDAGRASTGNKSNQSGDGGPDGERKDSAGRVMMNAAGKPAIFKAGKPTSEPDYFQTLIAAKEVGKDGEPALYWDNVPALTKAGNPVTWQGGKLSAKPKRSTSFEAAEKARKEAEAKAKGGNAG